MATFLIAGISLLAVVQLRKASRLHGTVADIAAAHRDVIENLRLYPAGGPVSRELWLFSRYGVLRFFRVEASGITEIGADGKVLLQTNPGGNPGDVRG
jgi:hypothetical protein